MQGVTSTVKMVSTPIEEGMTSSHSTSCIQAHEQDNVCKQVFPFCAIWSLKLHMFTTSKYPCACLVVPAHHSGTIAAPRLAAGASSSCHRAPRCTFPKFPPVRRRVADPDDLSWNIVSEDCDALKSSRREFQHTHDRSMVSDDRSHRLCNAQRVFAVKADGAIAGHTAEIVCQLTCFSDEAIA